MNNELLQLAATQGIWAVLFVILLYYILKNQANRDLRQEEREKNTRNCYKGWLINLIL